MQEFDFLLCTFVVKFIPFGDDGPLRKTGNWGQTVLLILISVFLFWQDKVVKAQIQQTQI